MSDFFYPPVAPAATPLRVAVIGAGWAGLAAAVRACQLGHRVSLFEASRQLGGRARSLPLRLPDGRELLADNGQHILIGAYSSCLALMHLLGVPAHALHRQPLRLQYPDGSGLRLPAGRWPAPLAAAWGMARARGWPWRERLALLARAARWRASGFDCPAQASVADLCAGLPARVLQDFIAPLCVSALNTPVDQASGQVFLRVLRDALLSQPGGADLLLPRQDLGALLPQPAGRWLTQRGAAVHLGQRIHALHPQGPRWRLEGAAHGPTDFDRVLIATAAPHASALLRASTAPAAQAPALDAWASLADGLRHTAISTVYAQAQPLDAAARWPAPMLALRDGPQAPAQFVFARDALHPASAPTGLLAFVISASAGAATDLGAAVTAQAQQQLGLRIQALRTVTEKRATFACTPGLQRPPARIAPGLLACGDYVQGPYPATLEGAVRSGRQAADLACCG